MKVVRLILGLMLWILVLGLASIPVSNESVMNLVEASSWLSGGTTIQLVMLISSLVLILGLSRGKPARYGFRMATGAQIKTTFVFGSIVAVVVHVILAILWRLMSPSGNNPVVAGASLLQIVVKVWIIASICEEVFYRGLIQSFLVPLRDYGATVFGVRLSLPIAIAAFLFGFSHIMLLTMGVDGFIVGGIVGSAIFLGLLAGYYREKTGSLLPAILVHLLFNVYGSASQYIQNLLMK